MYDSLIMWFAVFLVTSVLCWQTTVQTQPEVSRTFPPYGPRIGGTWVSIDGKNLSGITEVWLLFDQSNIEVQLTVNLTASRDNIIKCKTPVVDAVVIGHSGRFLLIFNDSNFEYNFTTTQTFMFKPDPVILDIAPGYSILSGGIRQTVSGRNLDSVVSAKMNVTLILHHNHYQQRDYGNEYSAGICTILNTTTMFCKSKRVSNWPLNSLPTYNPLRQDEYYFRVGFEMDGYTAYNFTEVVYWQNPEIHKFEVYGDKVKPFKVYKGQETIDIKGMGFMNGVSKDDYSILIGNGSKLDGQSADCVIVDFYSNLIRCKPPPEPPHIGDVHSNGSPCVTLQIGYIKEKVGYIRYELKPWDDPVVRTIVISVVCVAAALIIISPLVAHFVKRRPMRASSRQPPPNAPSADLWSRIPSDLKAALEPCIKSHDRLRLGRALGEGQFGQVHAAKFFADSGAPILVAAKTIKENNVSRQQLREFLEEATMMKEFNHPNVLHLVGVVVKQGRPFVLLPYMENGDLRSHLRNTNNMFMVENLLQYALQIAKGMEYITSRNFVHRDLAARNCMVSLDDNVKVADFGLAREVHTDDYYTIGDNMRPLPIKWMSIESLEDKKFTKYSDVWSFGVTFWEVMTRGKRPYADVDNFSIRQYLRRGKRLDKPDALSEDLYILMLRCWEFQPHERPSFTTIKSELESALEVDANDYVSAEKNNEPLVASDRGYQNLSRYVDHTTDRHVYLSMIDSPVIEPGEDHSTGIDYRGARAAFDAIDEGYLSPVNLNGGGDANDNAQGETASTNGTVYIEGNTAYYNHGYENIVSIERQTRQNVGTEYINLPYSSAGLP